MEPTLVLLFRNISKVCLYWKQAFYFSPSRGGLGIRYFKNVNLNPETLSVCDFTLFFSFLQVMNTHNKRTMLEKRQLFHDGIYYFFPERSHCLSVACMRRLTGWAGLFVFIVGWWVSPSAACWNVLESDGEPKLLSVSRSCLCMVACSLSLYECVCGHMCICMQTKMKALNKSILFSIKVWTSFLWRVMIMFLYNHEASWWF